MTADNTETEDMEEFHRSYLLKNEECEAEEERLTEKKNYRKYERDEEEFDDSEYSYESEKPRQTKRNQKTQKKSGRQSFTQPTWFTKIHCRTCREDPNQGILPPHLLLNGTSR